MSTINELCISRCFLVCCRLSYRFVFFCFRWGRYKLILGDPGPGAYSKSKFIHLRAHHTHDIQLRQEILHELKMYLTDDEDTDDYERSNSIFSHIFEPKQQKKQHSKEFVKMAMKYFEDHGLSFEHFWPEKYSSVIQSTTAEEASRIETSIYGAFTSNKEKYREMKRQFRLSTGASLQLADFKTVSDLFLANIRMQLYDVIGGVLIIEKL